MHEAHVTQCFGKELCETIAVRVISQLQMNTKDMQSVDGKLSSLWDEICVQVQGGPFFFWESYLEEVRGLVQDEVSKLREYERHGLWFLLLEWLQTNGGSAVALTASVVVDYIIDQHLLPEAAKCRTPQIVAFLDNRCEPLKPV